MVDFVSRRGFCFCRKPDSRGRDTSLRPTNERRLSSSLELGAISTTSPPTRNPPRRASAPVAPAVSRLVGLLAMVWMVVMVREYGSDACSSLCLSLLLCACASASVSLYLSQPRYAVVNDSLSYVLTLYRTRTRTRGRGRSRRRRERERERDTTRMDLIDGRRRRTTKSTNDSHQVLERVVKKTHCEYSHRVV